MLRFLNGFAEDNRDPNDDFLPEGKELFANAVKAFNAALGRRAFPHRCKPSAKCRRF